MSRANNSSEDFYLLLKKRLKKCFNPYNQQKHLEYLRDAADFANWCTHTYNNGKTAIKSGADKESSETWSQCKLCNKNLDLT